jgi:ABC-2 type transport system ATP-binding protein
VFVSSHILSEVQQTADQVAIIARGRLVKAGPVHDVLSAGRARGLIVKVADVPAAVRLLADAQIPAVVSGDALSVDLQPDQAERVTRALAAGDVYLSELRPDEVDLETVFLELTKDEGLGP